MELDDAEASLLIQATRASLAAAPFPPRRDLSCAGLSTPSRNEDVLFYDIFWLRRQQICCYAVRLPGGDRQIAAAHMLRMLMRAAMHRYTAEQAIHTSLAALRKQQLDTADIDIAAALLRVETGKASFATVGSGAVTCLRAQPALSLKDHREQWVRLGPDQHLWLTVGAVARPTSTDDMNIEDLVRSALAGTDGAAAIAVKLKKADRGCEQMYTLTNDVVEISGTLAEIDEQLLQKGLSESTRAGLGIALDEVLTNIILYAYGDGQAHEMILHVSLGETTLHIDICDDGTPFDPTTIPVVDTSSGLDDRPIGGLGMHFVRTVFDAVEYHRGRGWNTLVLTKHLHDEISPQPKGAALGSHSPSRDGDFE